jgi:hypothetical protein
MLLAVGALSHDSGGAAPSTFAVHDTVQFSTFGGIEIVLSDADFAAKRLTFTIRGPQVTSLPRRVPMTFHFDVPVKQATLLVPSSTLHTEILSNTYLVTCLFRREPFTPPMPWHVSVQVELEAFPRTGRIIVLNQAEKHVTYELTPAAPMQLSPPTAATP